VLNLRRTHELAHLTTKHLEQHGVSGRSRLWAASLQAMFDSLLVDLPPVVQASLDAGAREWAKREDAE
jgi:hypothetical protein